jgi:translin
VGGAGQNSRIKIPNKQHQTLLVTNTKGREILPTLKSLLGQIQRELSHKDQLRHEAQEDMRKATSLSKQAILLSHQKKMEEAKKRIDKAKELILKLTDLSKEYPAMIYGGGMFSAALQEYAEARIFIGLVEEKRFKTPEEIGVPSIEYALGLADVVGELRRLSLDALREGDVAKGEKCLQMMDEIYVELEGLDEAYMLVPGLRRKNDVSRRIIEATRGDITQEVRRKLLEDHLSLFEKAPRKRKG